MKIGKKLADGVLTSYMEIVGQIATLGRIIIEREQGKSSRIC